MVIGCAVCGEDDNNLNNTSILLVKNSSLQLVSPAGYHALSFKNDNIICFLVDCLAVQLFDTF